MERIYCPIPRGGFKSVWKRSFFVLSEEVCKKSSFLGLSLCSIFLLLSLIHCQPLPSQNTCDPFHKDFNTIFLIKASLNDKSATCGFRNKVSANLKVKDLFPAEGTSSVSRGGNIQFSFSESMDTSSLTIQSSPGVCSGSIQLSTDNFSSCEGASLDVSENPRIQILPKKLFKGGTNYKIRITNDVYNSSGENMVDTFTSETGFYTRGYWAYATNPTTGDIWMFTIDPATGVLINNSPATIPSAPGAISLAIHPSGKFLYCANQSSGSIYYYSIDPATGNLTSVNGIGAANATSFKIHPSGNFAFAVAASPTNEIYQYRIDPNTGTLTPNTIAQISTIGDPRDITIDPTGKYAFVPLFASGNINGYSIDSVGLLNPIAITPGGSNPVGINMDPSGKFLYWVNSNGNSVSIFSMDSTGLLSLAGGFLTGTTPWSIHFDPLGRFAYVANSASASTNVSIGILNPVTGLLTPVGGPLMASQGTRNFIVDPSGKYAYSTESTGNTVYMYKIVDSNGNLSYNTPAFTGVGVPGGYAIEIY
ncbi:beta-propeller fold lactonase family protein [Leptospira sp. 201903070]|uniref:Beta-propeller fold lactonase family protein n=1 Tax=Leptospira ainlahdjerensis TaxID=2810033 RepID=A0ABS2UAH7_9LEPT|nr:beta-propeller fold lactonase family protein [Leptospira ainlahdjerensis]MBM9576943.1 beta-propeller fold lactonase family protein [Leptospira ainlahdjerensis]